MDKKSIKNNLAKKRTEFGLLKPHLIEMKRESEKRCFHLDLFTYFIGIGSKLLCRASKYRSSNRYENIVIYIPFSKCNGACHIKITENKMKREETQKRKKEMNGKNGNSFDVLASQHAYNSNVERVSMLISDKFYNCSVSHRQKELFLRSAKN